MDNDLKAFKKFFHENWLPAAFYGGLIWIVLWAAMHELCWDGQTMAAWAGAIATSFGILGAAAIAIYQSNQNAELARQARRNEQIMRQREKVEAKISVAEQIRHLALFAQGPGPDAPKTLTQAEKLEMAKNFDLTFQKMFFKSLTSIPIIEIKDTWPLTQYHAICDKWIRGMNLMLTAKSSAIHGNPAAEAAFDRCAQHYAGFENNREHLAKYIEQQRGLITKMETSKGDNHLDTFDDAMT